MEENSTHHRKSKKLIVLHNLMGPDSEITEEQYQSRTAHSSIKAICLFSSVSAVSMRCLCIPAPTVNW